VKRWEREGWRRGLEWALALEVGDESKIAVDGGIDKVKKLTNKGKLKDRELTFDLITEFATRD